MQDHAKQGYTFGHLSLIWNLVLDIPSGVAGASQKRDCKLGASQKRDLGTFLGHLFFWVSGVESPLIFYTKKKKRKN